MLEMTLILILVVVDMVAIIVNRKSLLACITITVVSALLGLGFLILYANADKFGSHEKLLSFTITCSAVIIFALLAVSYIGVKMHFKNLKKSGKYVPGPAPEAAGEPRLIPGTNVLAKAVGIFGRQPIERTEGAAAVKAEPAVSYVQPVTEKVIAEPAHVAQPEPVKIEQTTVKPQPVKTAEPAPAAPVKAAPTADAMLRRMLDKGVAFKAAGQYVLAEQMYVTYIARCTDNISRADGELLMLECRIEAGNVEGAEQQLNDLLQKLRSREYLLTQEQKMKLADCKMALMKLKK